jgi:hypothetical protein
MTPTPDTDLDRAAPDLYGACAAALDWLGQFCEHAPRTFGGEAQLAEQLAAALAQTRSIHPAVLFWHAAAAELNRAQCKHPALHSAHEGYAVLLEEVEELWQCIKAQRHDHAAMRAELVQIAAMAARFALDVLEQDGQVSDASVRA